MAPYSSTLAWKIPLMEEPGGLHAVHGVAKSRTRLSDFTSQCIFHSVATSVLCFLILSASLLLFLWWSSILLLSLHAY